MLKKIVMAVLAFVLIGLGIVGMVDAATGIGFYPESWTSGTMWGLSIGMFLIGMAMPLILVFTMFANVILGFLKACWKVITWPFRKIWGFITGKNRAEKKAHKNEVKGKQQEIKNQEEDMKAQKAAIKQQEKEMKLKKKELRDTVASKGKK